MKELVVRMQKKLYEYGTMGSIMIHVSYHQCLGSGFSFFFFFFLLSFLYCVFFLDITFQLSMCNFRLWFLDPLLISYHQKMFSDQLIHFWYLYPNVYEYATCVYYCHLALKGLNTSALRLEILLYASSCGNHCSFFHCAICQQY